MKRREEKRRERREERERERERERVCVCVCVMCFLSSLSVSLCAHPQSPDLSFSLSRSHVGLEPGAQEAGWKAPSVEVAVSASKKKARQWEKKQGRVTQTVRLREPCLALGNKWLENSAAALPEGLGL